MKFEDFSAEEIDAVMQKAWHAFGLYKSYSFHQRAQFMQAIAEELQALGDQLIEVAMKETNLPESRLVGERGRTIFQLNSYAAACIKGEWLEVRIDSGDPDRKPPKPDIRKTKVPLGPVVVFGASNFPFAYSTAGGDTACAFAAGCPVIVKAHPAHAETSQLVAGAIERAASKTRMPEGIFAHVHGAGFETGRALVQHPMTKAVGFTGSYLGGKQLFDWGNQRKEPIPVFAEMGSINPIFLLPHKLSDGAAELASLCAGSITLGAGQFCTNPGLIIGMDSAGLQAFTSALGNEIRKAVPAPMLHPGIKRAYTENKANALVQSAVQLVAEAAQPAGEMDAMPTIATATGAAFLNNPVLHREVFGPYSIIISCHDEKELLAVAQHLEGQLTASVMATHQDILENEALLEAIKNLCGRLIYNNVPTGVEVCLSMHHGGPFPATTDSRFTSVGADGIKRFARPMAYQNWPDQLLPEELKAGNPLGIWRTVNNELVK